jgi:aerotaxis receptor
MSKATPLDEEYIYDGSAIITQTDLQGIITYANRSFSQASAYSVESVIGKEHNIIRHPDMPKIVFEKMWSTIQSGQAYNGVIKNIRKDGKFYWIDIEILPIRDDTDTITGYIAVAKAASRQDILENEMTYKKMLETQK